MTNFRKQFLTTVKVASLAFIVFSPITSATRYDEQVYRIQLMLEMMDKIHTFESTYSVNGDDDTTDLPGTNDDPYGQPPNSGGILTTSDGGGSSSCGGVNAC